MAKISFAKKGIILCHGQSGLLHDRLHHLVALKSVEFLPYYMEVFRPLKSRPLSVMDSVTEFVHWQ